MLKRFFTQPLFFGLCYVGSIPAYAWLYVTYGCLKGAVRPDWYDAVYLSVVTVTTLGYGDLVPQPESDMTKVLVSTQALFGVVMIGLFLNALSKQSTQRSQEAASRAIDALRGPLYYRIHLALQKFGQKALADDAIHSSHQRRVHHHESSFVVMRDLNLATKGADKDAEGEAILGALSDPSEWGAELKRRVDRLRRLIGLFNQELNRYASTLHPDVIQNMERMSTAARAAVTSIEAEQRLPYSMRSLNEVRRVLVDVRDAYLMLHGALIERAKQVEKRA